MPTRKQSKRLTKQHRKTHGAVGIFGEEAKIHDFEVFKVSKMVQEALVAEFPSLTFRYREEVAKREISEALHKWTRSWDKLYLFQRLELSPMGGLLRSKTIMALGGSF